MGRLVNRHLAEQGGIAGHTILVSSMSELLKIWHSMDLVLPWLPLWSIADELNTKRLVCPWPAKWAVPIQAYIYRMDTRLEQNG